MTHVPDLGAARRTLALAAAGLAGALALAPSAGAQGLGSGQVSRHDPGALPHRRGRAGALP